MDRIQDRVALFVDYQNCYRRAREAFFQVNDPAPCGQVRPRSLGTRLAQRRGVQRVLVGVFVFRGLPLVHHDPKGSSAAQRQLAQWDRESLVTAWSRALNYRDPARPKEKGVDVKIVVEMVTRAMSDEFDIAILFSDDTDFVPAIEAVMDIKGSDSACEVAAWVPQGGGRFNPIQLTNRRLWVNRLDVRDYGHVEDRTDYTLGRRR